VIGCGLLAVVVAAVLFITIAKPPPKATESAGSGPSDGERPTVPVDLDASMLSHAPLRTRGNHPTTLAAAHDQRPVLVNFWAQWCAPCVAEMPILERGRAANPGIRLAGINEMDQPDKASAMARRTGIGYEWFIDSDGSFAIASKTINLPTTLLLGPDGSVLRTRVGAFRSLRDLQHWIRGS
jgi:thiol-disulfide isomerase/thioredoxin